MDNSVQQKYDVDGDGKVSDNDIEDMEKQVAEEKAEQAPPEEKAPQQDTTNNTPDNTTGQ